jgi:hypothetical protein
MFLKKLASVISLGALICLLPSGAFSLALAHIRSDQEMISTMGIQVFEAAGRIGGQSTNELALNRTINEEDVFEKDYSWTSDEQVPFSLTYDRLNSMLTFVVGDNKTTMVFHPDAKLRVKNLYIRAFSRKEGTAVSVNSLMLDGKDLHDASFAAGPEGLDILHIAGTSLMNGFTLTGEVNLSWIEGERPDFSDLSFQIIGTTQPAPEPATFVMLGTGLAGWRFLRRKKKHHA